MRAEMPAMSFFCATLVLAAAPRLLQPRDAAVLCLVGWLFGLNLVFAIDSVVWAGNVRDVASIWCDITTKLVVGSFVAVPAACLGICINIERSLSPVGARRLPWTRHARLAERIALHAALPVVYMALHCIVQDHRYDIFEDVGCRPAIYMSTAAVFLVWIPPWALCIAATVYALLALRHLTRALGASAARPTLRLLALSLALTTWLVVASTLTFNLALLSGTQPGLRAWPPRFDRARVDVYATHDVPPLVRSLALCVWWSVPAAALLVGVVVGAGEVGTDGVRKMVRALRGGKEVSSPRTPEKLGVQIGGPEKDGFGHEHGESQASSPATIKFGPSPHDFFTIPEFGKEKALPARPVLPTISISPYTPPADFSPHRRSGSAISPTTVRLNLPLPPTPPPGASAHRLSTGDAAPSPASLSAYPFAHHGPRGGADPRRPNSGLFRTSLSAGEPDTLSALATPHDSFSSSAGSGSGSGSGAGSVSGTYSGGGGGGGGAPRISISSARVPRSPSDGAASSFFFPGPGPGPVSGRGRGSDGSSGASGPGGAYELELALSASPASAYAHRYSGHRPFDGSVGEIVVGPALPHVPSATAIFMTVVRETA